MNVLYNFYGGFMDINMIIMLFFIYSFLGWIVEEIDVLIETKKLTYRGFLIGPICPIYGVVSLLMILTLSSYIDSVFMIFCASFIMCSFVEYMTSLILEKIFNVRWWDYSRMKFNIEGRVVLRNSVFFGLAGVLLIYYVNPYLLEVLSNINMNVFTKFEYLFVGIFIMDLIVSLCILFNLKKMLVLEQFSLKSKVNNMINKDNTIEISKAVRDKIANTSIFHNKIIKGFPRIVFVNPIKKMRKKRK